ncbi:unnamed protein product [Acanthoscelides obtectus]|nr:unnamed protein product [Acanthoscelides obtectus]CAK1681811.1 Zinc finger X-chromosomal protein [Acanthoscelides obtectus]
MEYSSQNTDTHHFDEKAKAVLPFKRASNQDAMKQHPVVDKKTISESFFCHNCNYSARSKYLLISHMKEHNMCMSISSKIHKCSYCKYKTIHNSRPGKYMLKHPESAGNYQYSIKYSEYICIHCKAKFSSETALNNHIIKKHPDFNASVSSKIYECTHCAYKTTFKGCFVGHMLKHSETGSNSKFSICIHCKAKFTGKTQLNDHIIKKHPDLIASVSSKIYECTHCTYNTIFKGNFVRHTLKHLKTGNNYKFTICIHCKAKFRGKTELNDHIIKKHSDFIASVSSKIYECTLCTYKTTLKTRFGRHMLKHPETARNYKFRICIHCKAKFRDKTRLNDHIIKKHPGFIASVSSKIYECTHCTYKTTVKCIFVRHILKHSETGNNYKFRICIHCKAKFRDNTHLNDHIIKKHPGFIASISSKIYECTHCTYKTTFKGIFVRHMLKHSETGNNYKFSICIHCKAKFRDKTQLNDHIIKKHADFIASISSKIYECTHCTYKTTYKGSFFSHMPKHPETASNYKFSICTHCKAKFRNKTTLNDHIIKIHPDFIASVSSKILECTHCAYKTTSNSTFARHMLIHSVQ